jgi:Fe-S oxidoreductase
LFVDTFNRWFEPHNVRAAIRVLQAAGYRVHAAQPLTIGRPLCCGRTFLSAGLVEQAKAEARRTLHALKPWVDRGVAVIGLEPSCLLTFRDEFGAMLPGSDFLVRHSFLFEEFIARELDAGHFSANFTPMARTALLHGHCHQKAFDAMPAVTRVLELIPQLKVEVVESSCCGMAGSFGYEAEHYEVSMKMAEMSLLPAVRNSKDALVVADGTSCRHQIADGTGREAWHVARVLEQAL